MDETSTQEPRRPLLTVAANHFLPPSQHTEATTVIPIIGGGIAWAMRRGVSWLRRRNAYRELVRLETKWLNEAIAERDRPGISRKRREEIDLDIAERKQSLQQLQRDNTRVQ